MHDLKQILLGAAVVALPTIDGTSINGYVSTFAQAHNNFDLDGYSGRIAGARTVLFENGGGPLTMNLASYDDGQWSVMEGFTAKYIRSVDDMQTIVGTGTATYSHFVVSDPSQLSFAIELGNWEGGEWVTLATSGTMSYNDLTVTDSDGVHILQMRDGIGLVNFQPWAPTAYSVPEPSSGLLVLIGASLLALRRRRR